VCDCTPWPLTIIKQGSRRHKTRAFSYVLFGANAISAPALRSRDVLTTAFMSRRSNVTLPIACFVGVKVGNGALPAVRHGTDITIVGVKPIVHVSVEAPGSMKPWSRPDKTPTNEPVRSVIAVGSAVVRGVVEVSIGTLGREADTRGDLGRTRSRDDAPGKSHGAG
jgi:hypothetical protein